MAHLKALGIDPAWTIGMLVAVLVSWVMVNPLIRFMYERFLAKALPQVSDKTPEQVKNSREALRAQLGLDYGGILGRLERVLYIYAFMSGVHGVITVVIILKAFFGWIRSPSATAETELDQKGFVLYHAYIYGNLLSLLAALILAHGGLVLSNYLRPYL